MLNRFFLAIINLSQRLGQVENITLEGEYCSVTGQVGEKRYHLTVFVEEESKDA